MSGESEAEKRDVWRSHTTLCSKKELFEIQVYRYLPDIIAGPRFPAIVNLLTGRAGPLIRDRKQVGSSLPAGSNYHLHVRSAFYTSDLSWHVFQRVRGATSRIFVGRHGQFRPLRFSHCTSLFTKLAREMISVNLHVGRRNRRIIKYTRTGVRVGC